MDNRINDKDLEFVNGGAAATAELLIASYELRMALSLFTDDMPQSVRTNIAHVADVIDSGSTDVFAFKHIISTAINVLRSSMGTIAGNPDKSLMVNRILQHLNNALMYLNQ